MSKRLGFWLLALLLPTLVIGWPGAVTDSVEAAPLLRQDCLSYNPNTLSVFNDGGLWILTDGSSRMVAFTSESDAQLGLQVARLYNQHCFIGRGNSRPNRADYIFEYWQGNSGLGGSLPTNDCLNHNRSSLYIVDEGANGWLLTDGASRMVMFDNQSDAQQGLDVIRNYDQICYIGRGTDRIMTYLRSEMLLIDPGIIAIDPGVIVPALPPAVAIAPTDCLPYNPSALYIVNEGANGWLLTDGSSRMKMFDNETDANYGLQVAQAHNQHCFIGRGNARPNRADYIYEYWEGDSGLGIIPPDPDCLSHDPAALSIADEGANGWVLTAASERIAMFDNQADALLAQQVFQGYDQHCYIGRGNARPDRRAYIATYLRQSVTLGPPPVMPSGPDCLPYDPFALVLNDQGALGWTVTSGASSMMLLDNVFDAQLASNVAMAHTQQCFVGRDNTRPNRYAYIFEYWQGDSGLGLEPPLGDCINYNPAALTLVDSGANGWTVVDGASSLVLADNATDASMIRDVMMAHNMLCFIGRDNTRPDRDRYIHLYLRDAPVPGVPTPVPTLPPALPAGCATAPAPRMLVGHVGRVTFSTGEPVRVRTGPGTANAILTLLPEGTIFYVNGGPVCAEPYWWWSVQTGTGISGWMAEGVVGNYFIEPFSP
jgi:hypothetical protein